MVENAPLPPGTKRYDPAVVQSFLAAAFREVGISTDDAALIAEVLVGADLRGVRSHGAARLTYFLNYLERGTINVKPKMVFTQKTDTTGLLDADNGMGIIAAGRAMDEAMTMAGKHGTGFVGVANSSHFGYAGYWAERAMQKGFVGISMSNSGGRTAPTYSSEGMLGTNPFSVGINGGEGGTNFLLDMATTTVAVGKIETALREGREIPEGWVSEARGKPELDAKGVLKHDIPLLPLGGAGTEHGGHKGYGLNLMIELLCGALTGTPFADRIAGADGTSRPAMGHLFGAIQIQGFREPNAVHADMQETFRILRGAEKESGQDRVYIHGEPEAIATAENRRIGIPITPKILEQLHKVAERLRINDTL